VKIVPVNPEIICLKGLLKIYFKKKSTQAEHIARGASMPCGLNKNKKINTKYRKKKYPNKLCKSAKMINGKNKTNSRLQVICT